MSSVYTPPSTLDGIKKLAKSIKRELHVPHHEALELAAKRAGFNNVRDAQNRLAGICAPTYEVFLSAYWRTRTVPRKAGFETLRIKLPQPLSRVLRPREVENARNLGQFRLDAEDHLERRFDMESQQSAQDVLLAAARTLRFLAATGLRPVSTRRKRRALDLHSMPGRDHLSAWEEPETGTLVMLDEPYDVVEKLIEARAPWLRERSLVMVAPAWAGIYAPGHSHPFFVLKDELLGRRLQRDVEALATQPDVTWVGESRSYHERFVSPARAALGKGARPRTMPAYAGTIRAGAVAYGGRPGEKGRWRPVRPMAFSSHERASELLQSLSISMIPNRAYNHIQQARSELEDWLFLEHRDAAHERTDLYYGGASTRIATTAVRPALLELIELLSRGYEDCAPKRQMIDRLNRAAKAL